MFEKTIRDITAYLDFLREAGFPISVSELDDTFDSARADLSNYESRPLSICNYLKSRKETCERCAECELSSTGTGIRLNACYAGVEEYSVPIGHNDKIIAVLRISGYRGALKTGKANTTEQRTGENFGAEYNALYSVLSSDVPSEKKIRTITAPLEYMLEELYKECCERSEHYTVLDAYKRSLMYIREHYTEGISVADVARELGYSVSYFGYIFKRNMGISTNRYITDLQLSKAAELLVNSSYSISAISERVGFGDANYFSTAFKAKFGASPREYRNLKKQI